MLIAKSVNSKGSVSISSLFDTGAVGRVLGNVLDGCTGPTLRPTDARVERYWPDAKGRVTLEWSFGSQSGRRFHVFGLAAGELAINESSVPWLDGQAVRNLRVYVPQWDVVLHSSDRDPHLPHLAECLNESAMARRLAGALGRQSGSGFPGCAAPDLRLASGVRCRTIGYRAGRRAAIAYLPAEGGRILDGLVGKVYRSGRRLHVAGAYQSLNEQIARASCGGVRIPTPICSLPDLHMAVFAWTPGTKLRTCGLSLQKQSETVVAAMAALHRSQISDVPPFTVDDECAIIERWYRLLDAVHPPTARSAERLVSRLLQSSRSVSSTTGRTIHRDLYGEHVLHTRRTTTLLDLDTLARGDPCVDLGNWLAHLYFDLLLHGGDLHSIPPIRSTMVERYEALAGSIDRCNLAFYGASAAFRVGAVHALRATTGGRFAEMCRFAGELLDHSPWRTRI